MPDDLPPWQDRLQPSNEAICRAELFRSRPVVCEVACKTNPDNLSVPPVDIRPGRFDIADIINLSVPMDHEMVADALPTVVIDVIVSYLQAGRIGVNRFMVNHQILDIR